MPTARDAPTGGGPADEALRQAMGASLDGLLVALDLQQVGSAIFEDGVAEVAVMDAVRRSAADGGSMQPVTTGDRRP